MGFGLVIGFTEHLQTIITRNYSVIANADRLCISLQPALSPLSLQ
jgi:hypothetical protein